MIYTRVNPEYTVEVITKNSLPYTYKPWRMSKEQTLNAEVDLNTHDDCT